MKKNSLIVCKPFLIAFFLFMVLQYEVLIGAALGEVVIIANKNVPVDTLSKKDVKKIYLGTKTKWKDSSRIGFVILKSGPVHEEFIQTYFKRSSRQFSCYWKQMVFTGKGDFPKYFDTDEEVIKFLESSDGAIGYVSADKVSDKVKQIKVE